MDSIEDKDSNSVEACSPSITTIRDYSPSPSTTKNDTPTTSNRTPTPTSTSNRTPNPIPTLPNNTNINIMNANIIRIQPISHHQTIPTFQPLLTSINGDINNRDKSLKLNNNIPRIPLPQMMPKFTMNTLSLPPLPKELLPLNDNINNIDNNNNDKKAKRNKNRRRRRRIHRNNDKSKTEENNKRNNNNKLSIKMEIDEKDKNDENDENKFVRTTRSKSRSIAKRSKSKSKSKSSSSEISLSPTASESHCQSQSYSIITSAFNHNLKVKQEHLKDEPIIDISFDECYIFSMRCPYTDCCKLFNDMTSYQNHHIQKHQQRDKKGKLIQSKEAKWTCPECGKVSASWYNYAAHVTMHKDSCDAPWICKLPPINKKKYVKWTDGSLICGKRCSTKHNLIKHLKALHTNHRIIDLSQSVKAQSTSSSNSSISPTSTTRSNNDGDEYNINNPRRSPRKNKKRPCFRKTNTISPSPLLHDDGIVNVIKNNSFHSNYNNNNSFIDEPPKKRMKIDPDASCKYPMGASLPIFNTGDNINNWTRNYSPHKSVKQQGDFVGLLLEAAKIIEKQQKNNSHSPPPRPPLPDITSTPIQNVDALLSSIKAIFNSTASSLSTPISLQDLGELSAILALSTAAYGSMDLLNLNLNKLKNNNNNNNNNKSLDSLSTGINISNITDISAVPVPSSQSIMNNNKINNNNNKQIMPDIAIIPNMPSIAPKISPITSSNPAISLPKMPLPPPPPINNNTNNKISENGVNSLLRLLNYPNNNNNMNNMNNMNNNNNGSVLPLQFLPQIPTNIMVHNNTFNTFNGITSNPTNFRIPLIPTLAPINNMNMSMNNNNNKNMNIPLLLPTPTNISSIDPLSLLSSSCSNSKGNSNKIKKSFKNGKEERSDDEDGDISMDNNSTNNSVISNNILSALPRIMIHDDCNTKSS